jgi:hypothetical protein
LDWYHLAENLHKIGGSTKRLNQAEALLWKGQVDAAIAMFSNCNKKQAKNFCEYLRKHQHRIVNYEYFQAEGLYSIGSTAVESAINQIARRVQLFRCTVESRKRPASLSSSLCLSQWVNWFPTVCGLSIITHAKVTCSRISSPIA